MDKDLTSGTRRVVYGRLLRLYADIPATPDRAEVRWTALMAAHIVGQLDFMLHWDSHVRMLRLAWETRDPAEAAGQLLRLALAPVGHLFGRLPAGNVGRATVSAFRAMEPGPEVRSWILRATRRGS